jgi:hypothetical protein
MTNAPQMDLRYVIRQPQTAEEVQQVYRTKPENTERVPLTDSDVDTICGSLLGCLCWCCCLFVNNYNSDGNCCDCDCNGCDCGDCSECDC